MYFWNIDPDVCKEFMKGIENSVFNIFDNIIRREAEGFGKAIFFMSYDNNYLSLCKCEKYNSSVGLDVYGGVRDEQRMEYYQLVSRFGWNPSIYFSEYTKPMCYYLNQN